VYEKSHTRDINAMGGFAARMPGIWVAFMVGGLASFGLPGTSGFVAELLVFLGTFQARLGGALQGAFPLLFPIYAIGAVIAIVVTATYVLRVIERVFHGPLDEEKYGDLPNARTTEWVTLVVLGGLLVAIGVYPSWLLDLISGSLGPLLR